MATGLVGCSSGASSATTATIRPAALGTGSGRAPVPGPTTSAEFGDVVQTLSVDATPRSFRLAVPASYRRDHPTPLLFDFHGSGSDAVEQSAYSQLPKEGAAAGYLVVTPDAIGGNWDLATPGTQTADQRLVSSLESDLGSRYCVDRARIFAAGISLGSEFATIVSCDPANHIAAIGLVAAEYLLRPCRGPVPVLAFHGTADPIVPYANGATGRSVPGIPVVGAVQNLEAWARLDRCRPDPVVTTPAAGIVTRTWRGCAAGSSVVLHTVVGGGHTWPGSPVVLSAAEFGPTTEAISATHLMLVFFRTHPAPRG
jgi:polyhydroxybutyrate depolymerase